MKGCPLSTTDCTIKIAILASIDYIFKHITYRLHYINLFAKNMKGFGFPGSSGINNTPYRADTSSKKSELINILTRSEKLWNEEGKQEESLVQLRKAISILEFIVANEAIESVKTAYEEKLKELRGRLKDR